MKATSDIDDVSTRARDRAALPRPARPPGVRLLGPLQGSGFDERQWLVERDGAFVQVSEMLYRTLERCDGTRGVDAIAEDLSRMTAWEVVADVVERLIATKLVPLGLIAGTPSGDDASPAPRPNASAFGIHAKRRVLGPDTIDRIARPLSMLFAPVVVVAVLIAALAGHVWLYVSQSVTRPIAEVIAEPGLFLLVVALTLAAGVFHEFGHAAALRYGGGRARAMGFGFYLLFPAFYTDVTDGYRLSRSARIRTDLGGVYFHLIASLAILAVAALADASFLRLVVVLLEVEILRQLFPLVRMDGYWLLADVVGTPDPLSLVVPVLRRMLRLPGAVAGPKLRPRVQVFYVVYMALALIALPALTIVALSQLPTIVALIWHALGTELAALREAVDASSPLTLVAGVVHLALLALQLGGLAAFVVLVLWRPAYRAWRWTGSQAPPTRWTVRAAIATGVAGGLLAVGALLPWRSPSGLLGPGATGTSFAVGWACLLGGIVLIVAVPAVLLARRPAVRRAVAAAILVGAGAIAFAAGSYAVRADSAVERAIERTVRERAGRDATADEIARFRSLADRFGLSVGSGPGPYVAIGAAGLALVGAACLGVASGSATVAVGSAGAATAAPAPSAASIEP